MKGETQIFGIVYIFSILNDIHVYKLEQLGEFVQGPVQYGGWFKDSFEHNNLA